MLNPVQKQIVQYFINSCIANNMSMDESAQLAAHLLASTASLTGQTNLHFEIEGVGKVDVEC